MRAAIQYIRNFLTTNQTSKQTVIKNTFWLFVAEAVSKGSIAVVIILIGRFFGKEIFGQWSYLSVILTFLLVFADLGITQLTIRDRQHLDDTTRPAWLRSGLITKALLSIGVIIVYLGILWRQADSAFLRVIGLILLFQGIANSFLEYLRATFRSLQRSEVETRIKLRQWVGNLFLIPLLWFTRSLPLVLLGQWIITLATCGYAWWITHRRQILIASDAIVSRTALIRNGWMFALSGLFVSMYYYVDSLIIQWFHGYEAVGIYNAAYRLFVIFVIPIYMIWQSLTPQLRKIYIENKTEFYLNVIFYVKRIALVWWLIWFFLFLFSWGIIILTYWSSFTQSKEIFRILSFPLFIIYTYWIITAALQISWNEKKLLQITALWFIINLISNLIFIPFYWYIAAAYTTVITEWIVLVLWYFYFSQLHTNEKTI